MQTRVGMTQYKSSAYGGAYQYGDMDKEEAGMPQYREPEMLGMDHSAKLERSMRLQFIRKVYGILSIQLLLTIAVSALTVLHEPTNLYVLSHPGLAIAGMVLSLVTLIALMCYKDRSPHNMALLLVWTVLEAYTIGVTTAAYAHAGQGKAVLEALVLTAAVFVSLTVFTYQSKIDFSFLGGGLFAMLWILLIWGILGSIFGYIFEYVYALLGAIVFSLYIIFDTYLLLNRYSYDDYILAAVSLYLDILNLFLFILRLIAASDRRD